jgi:signal transduction histidine kinase
MSEVTPEYVASLTQSEYHDRLLDELRARSLIALPLLAHGRIFGSIVLIRSTDPRPYTSEDLSFAERVVLRAALAIENARLYDAAQHAVRARDEVLEVVAHDLRNPLSAILLQASRLASGSGEAEHRSRASVEGITRAATRMNRLIEDLLDVVRLEAGGLSIDATRVSANRALSDSVEAQEPLAASASLELRLDATHDLPDVWADRDRLLQIFENLIGNAVKFTPEGGRITVGASERGSDVLFWVADTGAGMGEDDLASVFDRFWQARRGERHGAGLGLAIAKGLVEAHGGRMWGESTLGRGTTFFFTIPSAFRTGERPREPAPHHH